MSGLQSELGPIPLLRLKEVLLAPFLYLIYLISGLIPRNRNLWVFGASDGRSFSDNPKWLFLHCVREKGNSNKSIWITRDRSISNRLKSEGLPVYPATSLRGLWYCLRAGVYIYNVYPGDINPWTWRRAIRVNLWHGIPLKKLGTDVEIQGHPIYKRRHGTPLQKLFWKMRTPWLDHPDDLAIGTSDFTSRLFAKIFAMSRDKVPITGYPRNDVLRSDTYEPARSVSELYYRLEGQRKAGKTVVAYMPTYRDQITEERSLPLDWEVLDEFLGRHNALFILKLHASDSIAEVPLNTMHNVIKIPSEADMYPFLRLVDILITDYSSVYFDYLLLDRPIIFYAYDLEDYLRRHRSMFFDYKEATPGPKAKDFGELLSVLGAILVDTNTYFSNWSRERERILDICHTYVDSDSCERVWREIHRQFSAGH